MRDHPKLRAFELADQLALHIYTITRAFPAEERFGLVSQMRRAALSTACNIVEGCARHTEGDFLRFLDMAYGSAPELEYQVSLAHRLGYLDDEEHERTTASAVEVCKVLNGLIRSIRAS
ncbi:four helix bundle protein [Leptolyngbya sp. 15MV]|nr:four helix bundle protein [Leptolyngbya sp. 15MV]